MAIQEKIGARIAERRKALGLTMKALAERTKSLKPSRINNWERGTRTPGPEEAMQLAEALEVSAAYLLCLTNTMEDLDLSSKMKPIRSVPLLDFEEACSPERINDLDYESYIPLSKDLEGKVSELCFALRVKDDSMSPDLKTGDIIIVEPSAQPKPGDFVVAKIANENEIIIRQYKQTSYSGSFELTPNNPNWPKAAINSKSDGTIIGVALEIRHFLKAD